MSWATYTFDPGDGAWNASYSDSTSAFADAVRAALSGSGQASERRSSEPRPKPRSVNERIPKRRLQPSRFRSDLLDGAKAFVLHHDGDAPQCLGVKQLDANLRSPTWERIVPHRLLVSGGAQRINLSA